MGEVTFGTPEREPDKYEQAIRKELSDHKLHESRELVEKVVKSIDCAPRTVQRKLKKLRESGIVLTDPEEVAEREPYKVRLI